MSLTAAEQYLIELINRARLDPLAEAARYGIDLNEGLAAGAIDGSSKQVLAPSAVLDQAATGHSTWMLAADIFDHVGANGTLPWDRAGALGYVGAMGENIAMAGSGSSAADLGRAVATHHEQFMHSHGHRENFMLGYYREIGVAQHQGTFTTPDGSWDNSVVTELFGVMGERVFLTGVAYADRDGDGFYSMGEGRAGVSLTAQGGHTTTATAGGYAIGVTARQAVAVTGVSGDTHFALTVDMRPGNVKLDVVGGHLLLTSGSVTLGRGIDDVRLLGVEQLHATGSAAANHLIGNSAGNHISGALGADWLVGAAGDDKLWGGTGADRLLGGVGHDFLLGGSGADGLLGGSGDDRLIGNTGTDSLTGGIGADSLNGGVGDDLLKGSAGNDRLTASAGNDRVWGGAGADDFVFSGNFSSEVIRDFSVQAGDDLLLNNSLWTGQLTAAQAVARFADVVRGDVVFDFGNGETITLDGVASLAGIAGCINIF